MLNYFFNENHFLILLISLVIIIFFSMYAVRQKRKFQKVFVFICGVLLLGLEASRIYWRYEYLSFNFLDKSFLNVVSLDFFTISLWISIPLIFIGSFLKKKDTKNIPILSFVFSVATLSAIISLIYPTAINPNFEFYHFYNLNYALLRSFIIMLGLFFAFAKWIKTDNFLDMWRGFFSLVFVGVVCFAIYYFLGQGTNLFYVEYCPAFYTLGIYLSFPWHFILLGMFLFVFQMFLYLPFRIYKYFKYRSTN